MEYLFRESAIRVLAIHVSNVQFGEDHLHLSYP
jgi:hypothetical protein